MLFAYLVAIVLFVWGLKKLGKPATAVQGNLYSALGMGIAVLATLFDKQILSFGWIVGGLCVGVAIGYWMAKTVKMTAMPEMVALLNGFGGASSVCVGLAAPFIEAKPGVFFWVVALCSILIGALTFTGSLVAWGKLSERIPSVPLVFPRQRVVLVVLIVVAVLLSAFVPMLSVDMAMKVCVLLIVISGVIGVLSVLSIGGGDMPVVIALLNSYSGLAACAAGFVTQNSVLVVAGALVGASGIILSLIMCKAMNRSLTNVLFGGFGANAVQSTGQALGRVQPISAADTFVLLEAARQVLIVPGYGLAVAQAQHSVRELVSFLEANGCEVRFAIHPVAGRMPGHMNVLLAEANISYDVLVDLETANAMMSGVDVAIVIGANDVVNPDARDNEASTIYGMPIINSDYAKAVLVLKRSMNKGFAGIENPLFFKPNVRMLFGDAKASLQALVAEFKSI